MFLPTGISTASAALAETFDMKNIYSAVVFLLAGLSEISLTQAQSFPAKVLIVRAEERYSSCLSASTEKMIWNTALSVDDAVRKAQASCERTLLQARAAYLSSLSDLSHQDLEQKASRYASHFREMQWRFTAWMIAEFRYQCVELRSIAPSCKRTELSELD